MFGIHVLSHLQFIFDIYLIPVFNAWKLGMK
jgi:hypothetical protein